MSPKTLFHIFLQVALLCTVAHAFGYRYSFNPGTGQEYLWTLVPGQEAPLQVGNSDYFYRGGRGGQYEFRNSRGELERKCQADQFFSRSLGRCVYNDAYNRRSRDYYNNRNYYRNY